MTAVNKDPRDIILVKGAVPGARGRIVFVRNAVKGA